MKINLDFITNSSSTIYIVAIPENLTLDTEIFLKYYNARIIDEEEQTEAALNLANELIDTLKNGNVIWEEDTDESVFWPLLDALTDNVFESVEVSGGSGISPILQNRIERWLVKNTLDKISLKEGKELKHED